MSRFSQEAATPPLLRASCSRESSVQAAKKRSSPERRSISSARERKIAAGSRSLPTSATAPEGTGRRVTISEKRTSSSSCPSSRIQEARDVIEVFRRAAGDAAGDEAPRA